VPTIQCADITPSHEDPKFKLDADTKDEIRTLCWCRNGDMAVTRIADHSFADGCFGANFSRRTSASIVARRSFEAGSSLAKVLRDFVTPSYFTGSILFQDLSDFIAGDNQRVTFDRHPQFEPSLGSERMALHSLFSPE